jgi:glycosyltransferase involved in cell wall biosynthesis
MKQLKLMFFVNGSEQSAAGVRAQMFAKRFPSEWSIKLNYRPVPKWKGIVRFLLAALKFRPHVVYVMDTAYAGVMAGCIAKSLIGCSLITDTGDVTYALARSEGIYSNAQLALIQWIEQMAIKESDCLIVRGSYHKSWLETQGIHNVMFVPDGVDISAIQPVDATSLRTELGLNDDLVVGLLGTMIWSKRHQMCYGWDIIEAMALLKDQPIKVLLVGDGDGRTFLKKRAQQLGISHKVVFTGRISYENLPQYLSAMNVCISTQSNDLVGMVRTTGKLPLYLAYGKYVIATNVGEAKNVLPGVGCLLPYEGVRDDNHPIRLAQTLRELLDRPKHLEIKLKARQVAKDNFDYDMLSKKIVGVCLQLSRVT